MGLLSKLSTMFQAHPGSSDTISRAISQFSRILPELSAQPNSAATISPSIREAVEYFQRTIAEIPGPFSISAEQYRHYSPLAALFPNPDEITSSLGKSIAVRNALDWFAQHRHEQAVALLGIRHYPVANGPMPLTDHTLRSLGKDVDDCRLSLCETAFNSLLKSFASASEERRRLWNLAHNAKTIGKEAPGRQSHPGADTADPATGEEPTWERELGALLQHLAHPGSFMHIEDPTHSLTLETGTTPVCLPLMTSSDRRRWHVCLVQFSVDEAMRAITKEASANRYILI